MAKRKLLNSEREIILSTALISYGTIAHLNGLLNTGYQL